MVITSPEDGRELPSKVEGPVVCEPNIHRVVSRGFFQGENPLQFTLPLILIQVGSLTLCSAVFYTLLRPFRLPKFSADIMGGIFLGPSFIAYHEIIDNAFFLPKGVMNLDVLERIGLIFLNFLLGVKIDMSAIKKSGPVCLAMGLLAFLLPIFTNFLMLLLKIKINQVVFHDNDSEPMNTIGFLQNMIFFQVTYEILKELRLLNSELGRLAISCSMVSSILSWSKGIFAQFTYLISTGKVGAVIASSFFMVMLVLVVYYVFRPVMHWMIKETPEGQQTKESYICVITLMVIGMGMYCQLTGLPGTTGAALLGFVVPVGSTLATTLVDKLESFVVAFLLPCFVVNVGRKVDIYQVTMWGFCQVELSFLAGMFGKVLGCVLPSFVYNVPFVDAFVIGLLLACQGLLDIHFFCAALKAEVINTEGFTVIVFMSIVHLSIVIPWVSHLYDPSKRFITYRRRTIQHAKSKAELRILACIINEEDVLSMINVLEASNASRESQIGVYVLDLEDLAGRALPLLIPHRMNRMPSNKSSRINRIIRAFHQYESRNEGLVCVQCFTSIAPYSTIHEDICSMALEKIVSLIIIPFHISDATTVKKLTETVIAHSPCSVGILVERGRLKESRVTGNSWFNMKVCVIFMGGPDDREALAYGTRMVEHANVTLSVINIFDTESVKIDTKEAKNDMVAIHNFKLATIQNSRVVYKEEGVACAEGMTKAVSKVDESAVFDMIMIGRRHNDSCALVSGLLEWCDFKELGVVGDMLLSSKSKGNASILVVQQQAYAGDQEDKPDHVDLDHNNTSGNILEGRIKSIDNRKHQQQLHRSTSDAMVGITSDAMVGITSPTLRDLENCTSQSSQ